MNYFKPKWYSELCTEEDGHIFSMEANDILYQGKSAYQNILVFKSKSFGTVLVLDNAIQCTERDEFTYQEAIAFLPLNSHPNPEKVLVIGGGDGGVVREVVKHPKVKSVIHCEIDEEVVRVSKEFLPQMAKGFYDPKTKLVIEDGFKYLKNHPGEFDVIITDSSDPEGPAESLFTESFYELIKKALRPSGIFCSQGETIFFDLKLIQTMRDTCKKLFPVVEYATIHVPTYPGGQIGFILGSLDPDLNFREPVFEMNLTDIDTYDLKFYTKDIHKAAFALPAFVLRKFNEPPEINCNT